MKKVSGSSSRSRNWPRPQNQETMRELTVLKIREKLDVSSAQNRLAKLGNSLESLFTRFFTLPQKIRYDAHSITKIVEGHRGVIDQMFAGLLEDLFRYVEKT